MSAIDQPNATQQSFGRNVRNFWSTVRFRRFIQTSLVVVVLFICSTGYGIPPLGLTMLDAEEDIEHTRARLSVIDDTAYISGRRELWIVDDDALLLPLRVLHPELGDFSNPTPIIRGDDGRLYVGASFYGGENFNSIARGAAIFQLSHPKMPIFIPLYAWNGDYHMVGIGSDLRGVANDRNGFQPVRLHPDGTVTNFDVPEGEFSGGFVNAVSASGYAVGAADIPNTAGIGSAIWRPDNAFFFLGDTGGVARSVRDRSDGMGINIGWTDQWSTLSLGDREEIQPRKPSGDLILTGDVLISESDFAVLRLDGFQPGLVQGQPDIALPIEQLFPELAMVDISRITDVTSVDGHIFMTISGDDGLFLFGAPAPVSIPEPATWVLLLLTAVAVGLRVCWRGRG